MLRQQVAGLLHAVDDARREFGFAKVAGHGVRQLPPEFIPALCMNGLIANATSPALQGRTQGASQSIQSVSRFLAPLLAGLLYELSASLPYFASGAILLVAFALFIAVAGSLKFANALSS